MQVAATNNSLPISTQIIKKTGPAAQAPDASLNPEQINKTVDKASDRVSSAQASREQTQTDRRTYATQLYSANSQKNQLDIYMAVASEGEADSPSKSTPSTQQVLDAYRAKDRLDIGNILSQPKPTPSERPQPYVDTRA